MIDLNKPIRTKVDTLALAPGSPVKVLGVTDTARIRIQFDGQAPRHSEVAIGAFLSNFENYDPADPATVHSAGFVVDENGEEVRVQGDAVDDGEPMVVSNGPVQIDTALPIRGKVSLAKIAAPIIRADGVVLRETDHVSLSMTNELFVQMHENYHPEPAEVNKITGKPVGDCTGPGLGKWRVMEIARFRWPKLYLAGELTIDKCCDRAGCVKAIASDGWTVNHIDSGSFLQDFEPVPHEFQTQRELDKEFPSRPTKMVMESTPGHGESAYRRLVEKNEVTWLPREPWDVAQLDAGAGLEIGSRVSIPERTCEVRTAESDWPNKVWIDLPIFGPASGKPDIGSFRADMIIGVRDYPNCSDRCLIQFPHHDVEVLLSRDAVLAKLRHAAQQPTPLTEYEPKPAATPEAFS